LSLSRRRDENVAWGGGLVPFITVAAYQATHSLGNALIYAVCFLLGLLFMPETRHHSIWEPHRHIPKAKAA
jgi:hypothetical protein